jgi:hypothetical protein
VVPPVCLSLLPLFPHRSSLPLQRPSSHWIPLPRQRCASGPCSRRRSRGRLQLPRRRSRGLLPLPRPTPPPATTSCPRMAPPSTGARASSAKRQRFSRDPPYSSFPYVVGRTPPSSSVGTRRGRCWRSARRSPPTCARALAGGARGGGPLAPAHGRRARGADARKLLERGARGGGGRGCAPEKKTGVVDETNVSPQWGFHAITNILETTLIRFIPTKPFPSLSSQFHAKISFF